MQLLNSETKRRRFVWPGEPWLQLEESARARGGFFGFQVRDEKTINHLSHSSRPGENINCSRVVIFFGLSRSWFGRNTSSWPLLGYWSLCADGDETLFTWTRSSLHLPPHRPGSPGIKAAHYVPSPIFSGHLPQQHAYPVHLKVIYTLDILAYICLCSYTFYS
jgi:hypothetical protein